MPYIFPKRFLRPRDVLDPTEFNEDTSPVQQLLDGEVDRHNLSKSIKDFIKAHPDADDLHGSTNVALAEGAYYTSHYAAVEVPVIFGQAGKPAQHNEPPKQNVVRSPNFVKPNGDVYRHAGIEWDEMPAIAPDQDLYSAFHGSGGASNLPSIIPNHGSWSAVQNADLSGSMKITVSTGQANLYINAYAQYVWQGFYEPKSPWRYEGPNAETTLNSYESVHFQELAVEEARILNKYGPSYSWYYWIYPFVGNYYITGHRDESGIRSWFTEFFDGLYTVNPYCRNPDQLPRLDPGAAYAHPLNELTDPEDERRNPQFGGYHHISRGFYPANVQFALRVDGRIIEETITGKHYSFEETSHGLRVEDSLPPVGKSDAAAEDYAIGQRSALFEMNFTDEGRINPGQKIRSSRASACGPEVLPVRIGAVVPVSPGTHTIEIVARRLSRKRKKLEYGDFVGVHSRRLHAMVLPILSNQSDREKDRLPVQVTNLQSENLIETLEHATKYQSLADRINSLSPSDIKKHSLPNTHLPSKVKYWKSVGWSPSRTRERSRVLKTVDGAKADCEFPGWDFWNFINKRTYGTWDNDYDDVGADGKWRGAGWQMLTSEERGNLRIADTQNLKLAANEELLIFADIQVDNLIIPKLPAEMLGHIEALSTSGLTSKYARSNWLSYLVADRYLDLYGLLALGYRTGSDENENWTIATKFAPAVINNIAWANRDKAFLCQDGFESTSFPTSSGSSFDVGADIETGFSDLDPAEVDLRGNQTLPGNSGISVPLFARLTKDDFATDAESEITEVAVFGCTSIPSYWMTKYAGDQSKIPSDEYTGRRLIFGDYVFPVPYSVEGATDIEEDEFVYTHVRSDAYPIKNAWKSPLYGRKIVPALEMNFGMGRLTVIKVLK